MNLMKMQQVSNNCYAVLNEKNHACNANSGLSARAGGMVIDTQPDLAHVRHLQWYQARGRGCANMAGG